MSLLRRMTAKDLPQVLQLWESCEGLTLSADVDTPAALTRYLSLQAAHCFVVEIQQTVVGAVISGTDGRRGYLYHLAVDKRYRRQGFGRALAKACLDSFEQLHILKCHLMVRSDNPEGRAFWQHLGWQLRPDVDLLSHLSVS